MESTLFYKYRLAEIFQFVSIAVCVAGECNLDICEEDIIKNCVVSDVTAGGQCICSENSPAIVPETACLSSILQNFSHNINTNYAVKTSDGKLAGIITLEHLKESLQIMELSDAIMAMDILEPSAASCQPGDALSDVIKAFESFDTAALPIVDKDGRVLGMIERNIIDHYLHAQVLALHQKLASMDA